MYDIEQERIRVRNQTNKAIALGKRGTLKLQEWIQTITDFNGTCAYCLVRPFDLLEHFVLIEMAGTHVNNCVPACYSCNIKKRNLTGDALIDKIGQETFDRVKAYLDLRVESTEACNLLGKKTRAPRSPQKKPRETYIASSNDPYQPLDFVAEKLCLNRSQLRYCLYKYSITTHQFRFNRLSFLAKEDIEYLSNRLQVN